MPVEREEKFLMPNAAVAMYIQYIVSKCSNQRYLLCK